MGEYVSYRIYKDSWKSDTYLKCNVPINTNPSGASSIDSYKSAEYLLQNHPDYFSYDYTIITLKPYSYSKYTSQIPYEEGVKWYFTENSYIHLYNNDIHFVLPDGTGMGFSASGATFLISCDPNNKSAYGYSARMVYDDEWVYTYRKKAFYTLYEGAEIWEDDSDPYAPGGNSGTGGGTGTFSGTGDSIEFPGLPTLSAVSTGFITLFNPSIAQMQSLANYMWSDLFDLDTFKKIFADPMDCILGLSIVPVAVPNGGTAEVKVGNISTGVSMTVASTQYVDVDCGTLNVQEYWGSYLDYDPYTKAEIYLPYCGTHPIAVDDIMGKSVHVKYHVDILSGACVAYVKCGSSVLYSFIGQCTSSIPITGNDWTNVVNGAISIASAIGSMVATGGATAPLVMPGVASTAVNSLKPSVEKSGSMSGTGGMLAVQTPYLILTRPRQALPKNQNTYTGYPSFIKEKLSDLKGYTEVAEIRLSGVDATDAELDEIVGLLKGGVII